VAENKVEIFEIQLDSRIIRSHVFGQEVNTETCAITRADLFLKGEGEQAEHISHGSTLSRDAFPSREFDFILSNLFVA
jgi:type I restriction enzyme M protein